jgi:hypothetical protein
MLVLPRLSEWWSVFQSVVVTDAGRRTKTRIDMHTPLRGIRVLLVVVTVCIVTAAVPGAQEQAARPSPDARLVADFTGLRMFLELTALLEQDREPTPEQWDRLFRTPGYAALTKSEFRREFFIERFRLAFMPSKKAELEAQLTRDTAYLPYYVKVKGLRREIELRAAQLATADFQGAVARAKSFLPPGVGTAETPQVAFVVFAPDARGYDPIVVDILFKTQPDEFLDLAAHEFHHWYRRRLAPDFQRDADALWVIDQVHLEGTADQINVPAWITKPRDTLERPERDYVESYAKSADIIREMDRLLAQMGAEPGKRRELGARLRKVVPRAGHPTGYFMAETIVSTLGRAALVRTAANPFAFFRVYNEAARRNQQATPLFSEAALRFLASLEQRYAR